MKIKNYIVENYQLFMDCLEQELCIKGISYVRIDNEIHFQDQIIRFFDYEVNKKEIINYYLMNMVETGFNLPSFDGDSFISSPFIDSSSMSKEYRPNPIYQPRNKRNRKMESHLVKQKLKNYRK